MSDKTPQYVFAVATTLVFAPQRLRITAGQTWHADHPVVASHPDLFSTEPPEILPRDFIPPERSEKKVDKKVQRKVEKATAAPGEKRKTSRAD